MTAATNDLSTVLKAREDAATNDLSTVLKARMDSGTNDLSTVLKARMDSEVAAGTNNVDASKLYGSIADGRLSGNVSLLGSSIDLSGAEATGTLAAGRFPALTGDVTTSAGSLATTLAAGNAGNLNSGTLLAARMPALTGDITTSAGSVATTLATGNAGNLNSGTLLAARMPAHTGDVTSSAGSVALTLAAGNAGNLNSGTLLAARMPALTGDVTTSAGAVATTLQVFPRVWAGNSANSLLGAGVTVFFAPNGNGQTNLQTSDVSTFTRNVVTRTTTLQNLYIILSAAPGASRVCTVTVMTNGVASSVVATASAAGTTGNSGALSDTIVAGVEVGIRVVTVASATSTKITWSLEGK
jgi:hypothetical protein